MPDEARIALRQEGAVVVVTLHHPPENRLTQDMIRELTAAVAGIEKEETVRAAVVTGSGGGTFCGGLDALEWASLTPRDAQEAFQRGFEALWGLEHVTKPTIAAVEGACEGVGAELALACDLRFASGSAVFAFPEVDQAWMPSYGATARLPRMIGRGNALELFLHGAKVGAREAADLGFVEHVVPEGTALASALRLAEAFARKPRASVRAIKRALTEGEEKPYRNRFLLETQHAVQLLWTDEYRAGQEKTRKKAP